MLQRTSAEKGALLRVLVTGAGGTQGLALTLALEQAGHEPVLQDVRDVDTHYAFVRGDVRSPQDVLEAARGGDVIVHAAAPQTPRDARTSASAMTTVISPYRAVRTVVAVAMSSVSRR